MTSTGSNGSTTAINIETRVEAKRGCGYRKPGGIYLVGGGETVPCGRLPIPLRVCPACHAGIKPTRGYTWINARKLIGGHDATKHIAGRLITLRDELRTKRGEKLLTSIVDELHAQFPAAPACTVESLADDAALTKRGSRLNLVHQTCPLADHNLPEKAGLLWVGEKFYKTPADFMREAGEQGISRRLAAVPNDFQVGETWVLLAHRNGRETHRTWHILVDGERNEMEFDTEADARARCDQQLGWDYEVEVHYEPAIFTTFRPSALEYVVDPEHDDDEKLQRLAERGFTLVNVVRGGPGALDQESEDDDDDA